MKKQQQKTNKQQKQPKNKQKKGSFFV